MWHFLILIYQSCQHLTCYICTLFVMQDCSVSELTIKTKIDVIFYFQELKQARNQFRDQYENRPKMQGPKVHFRLKTKDGIRISRAKGSYQALYTIYNHGSLAINFANIFHLIVITPLFFLLPLCLFLPIIPCLSYHYSYYNPVIQYHTKINIYLLTLNNI